MLRYTCSILCFLIVGAYAMADPPGANDLARRLDMIGGHVALAGKAFDDAVAALHSDDLKPFAKAYQRMVRQFGHIADRLVDSQITLGQAQARHELTDKHIARLQEALRSPQKNPATLDVTLLREQVLQQMQTIRERYAQASPSEQADLVQHLHQLVEHLRQLEQWSATVRQGQAPLVHDAHLDGLQRLHKHVGAQLTQEEKMLQLLAGTHAQLLDTMPSQLQHSLTLLQAREALPTGHLAKLKQQRQALSDFMTKLQAARKDAARSIVPDTTVPTHPGLRPADVLRQVDAILQPSK